MAGALEHRLAAAWLRRGPLACLLYPLSLLFRAAVALRRAAYRAGWRSVQRLPVPVWVVGNLIAGGAGKTPAVIAVVAWLRGRGWTPGVVSRGHGGSAAGPLAVTRDTAAALCGDEPLLVHLRSGAPLVVGRDRAGAARELLRLHPRVDIVVADDGLQHLGLARDAQLIVFDERGAGNGWLLPAGPLREPLPRQVPARSVVIYNAPRPSTPLAGGLATRRLAGAVALAGWWAGAAPTLAALHALRGRPLVAAAGLARPKRFFDMLRAEGLAPTELPLGDHHDFRRLPWPAGTADVVLTEKDAVKLPPGTALGATRVWVAPLDFAFDDATGERLAALLPARPAPLPPAPEE